jgi:hypothetical protein
MSNKANDYGQLFCQAVDTIVKERLSNINYDKTILCTIEEVKDKEKGRYLVSYTDAKFEAYALNDVKYTKGSQVYVQIPNSDWNEIKFIIAKKTEDANIPVNYYYPFDRYIDITGNIVEESKTGYLIANGSELSYSIWSYTPKAGEFNGYTRLGIQAGFRSWLAEDRVISGSYGLRLRVKIGQDETYYDFKLDSSDMIGDPYNFDTYFQQEKLFNIADLTDITAMELQFYQSKDFKTATGKELSDLDENLFVKDVYISFGYDAEEIDSDAVVLYSPSALTYSFDSPTKKNTKELYARWIYNLKQVNEGFNEIDYTLKWYRYKLGANSPEIPYSGIDWELYSTQTVQEGEIAEADVEFNKITFDPNPANAYERFKVLVSYTDKDGHSIQKQSSIFTFSNESEVVSEITRDALTALTIECKDGSNGNYMIYNLGGGILDSADSNKERGLQLFFHGEPLTQAESVEWIVPTNSTMLKVKDKILYRTFDEWEVDENASQLKYQIKNSYNQNYSNNTIQCKVVINKVVYTATKEFTFGPAGTAGSNYTLLLDFNDTNVKAIPCKDAGTDDEQFKIIARLYDFAGKEIEDFTDTFPVTWKLLAYPNAASGLEIETTQAAINTLTIDYKTLTMSDLYFVSATIQQKIDDKKTRSLTAYLPIPLYKWQEGNSVQYDHIQGAT